jgi:hypothetical protein
LELFTPDKIIWNADLIITLAILGLQVVKLMMLLCFRKSVAFGHQILMVFVELAISTGLSVASWNLEKSLSAYLLSLSLSMLILETPLLL